MSTTGSDKGPTRPSDWQQRIEGEWHGLPTVFDAQGHQVGHIKVSRSSVFEGGRTTYFMDTAMEATGPLRSRFEARDFAFGVVDSDRDRIYLGPDFMGAGQPWGALVDAHYYSPGWMADLQTMVHILPDGKTQAYSSMLYEGPTVIAVFNGVYKNATDYGKNPETTRTIDAFLDQERKKGPTPHVLPFKKSGRWTGELTSYGPGQQPTGTTQVKIDYRPLTLLRAEMNVHVSGAFERHFRYERTRHGNLHTFDGPEVYGNGIAYGRALYTSQHFFGAALKIRGREFLVDDAYTLSVVWKVYASDQLKHVLFGCLRWEEGEDVLKANYTG